MNRLQVLGAIARAAVREAAEDPGQWVDPFSVPFSDPEADQNLDPDLDQVRFENGWWEVGFNGDYSDFDNMDHAVEALQYSWHEQLDYLALEEYTEAQVEDIVKEVARDFAGIIV